MSETKKYKGMVHHCFNCGEETDNDEYLPNGATLYICESAKCDKEFRDLWRDVYSEMTSRAEEDNYSKYSY